MNDPLGLFDDENQGSDPLGLFSDEPPSRLDKLKGMGEAGLGLATGMVAQIPAGIGALLHIGNEATQGRLDPKQAEKVFEELQRKMSYEPRTELGKEYLDEAAKSQFMQTLNAIGGVGHTMPPVRTAPSIRSLVPKETPIPKSRFDKLDALETQKPPEAVKPTGGMTPELDLFSPDQKQLGVSPYDAVGGKWLVDENGIPVKQKLSEEVSRTADADQLRLFDDPKDTVDAGTQKALFEEKLAKQAEEGKITKAAQVEEMYARNAETKKLQEQVNQLKERLEAPRRAPRGQRGAIDLEEIGRGLKFLKEGFISARDYVETFRGTYNPKEWGSMTKALDNPGSRDTIMLMSPDQFHQMAHERIPTEINSPGAAYRRGVIKVNIDRPNGLDDIPYLKGNLESDGTFKVTAHNGRHRMDVLKEKGLELVPVRVRNLDPEFKGWGHWDTNVSQMIGQEGKTIPAPEPLTKRGVGTPDKLPELSLLPLSSVPKSQRGGIDLKSIREGVRSIADRFSKGDNTPIKDQDFTTPKERALKSLPGLKDSMDSWIPNDPTASEILSTALSEGDSNLTMRGVQSGSTLTGMKYNSSLITGVGRLFQNAQKRSEKLIRDIVYPVEHTFKKLTKAEVQDLAELFKREQVDGKVYTPEMLAEAGFSEGQIKAHQQLRQAFDAAYERQVQALQTAGRKKIPTKREAYLSSRWNGDWHVPVYSKDGKLVWYIAETSKRGAEKALQYLKDQGIEIDTTKTKVQFSKNSSRRSNNVNDAYLTMLQILDPEDSRVATIKSVMEDYMANSGYQSLAQSKHFETKAGVRGFVGDRPWKSPKSESYNLFREQFDYIKNAFTWSELQNAVKTSKEVLSNDQLVQSQPNNVKYAQQYAKNKLGFGEQAFVRDMENFIAENMGTSKKAFYDVVDTAKSFFILTKLGFNLGFAGANFVQPLFTAPMHANLSSLGYKHNPARTFILGGMDGFAGYLNHKGANVKMTEIGQYALKYAEDNGIVSRDMFDETASLGRHPVIENAEQIASTSIKEVEHMARLNAFMGYVHHLDQTGMYKDPSKLFQHAEELTNATMVDYRPGEGPLVFDQAGLVGNTLKTLQTFKFNYYNQLHHFYKEAEAGRPKGLITFLGMQAALGGALGMPFMQTVEDGWEMIKEILPDAAHLSVKEFTPKKWLIENLPDWAAYGGVSKLTGANMSSRFDTGNLADFSFDGMFPFVADIANQVGKVGKAAMNPNQTTLAEAAYAIAPPGPIQGTVETNMDAFKGPKTPEGNTPYMNPRNIQAQDANFVRTPEQEVYRRFGVTELEESKYKDLRYRQNQIERQNKERRDALAEKYFDATVRQDMKDIQKYMYRYVQYGGDPQTLIDRLESDAIRRSVPKETIDAMKAQSLSAVQKTKRMKEVLNGFNK